MPVSTVKERKKMEAEERRESWRKAGALLRSAFAARFLVGANCTRALTIIDKYDFPRTPQEVAAKEDGCSSSVSLQCWKRLIPAEERRQAREETRRAPSIIALVCVDKGQGCCGIAKEPRVAHLEAMQGV